MKYRLTIVTIGYQCFKNTCVTLKSVDTQSELPYEHIVILRKFTNQEKLQLEKKFSKKYRKFFYDIDTSIFNAMNKGLDITKGDFILYLNSADIFYSSDSIHTINLNLVEKKILSFQTLQKYEDLNIIRNNKMFKKNKLYWQHTMTNPPHQGFIAPLDKSIRYNEILKVSADNSWMHDNMKKYEIFYSDIILVIFQLGGQSTYPYLRTLWLFLKYENRIAFIKILIKAIVSIFLSKKSYYKLMAKARSFKFYEGEIK
jgi:hypothetical protein